MATQVELRQQLLQLDQQSYKAYKAIQGHYTFPAFTLIIDRVQSDPFASQCQVQLAQAIAAAMVYAQQYLDSKRTLAEILNRVITDLETKGLDLLTPFPQGDLVMFRRFELAAAINRLQIKILSGLTK